MRMRGVLGAAAVIVVFGLFLSAQAYGDEAIKKTGKTLDNLQTAFNGESNANARYLAFAKKADEEGYTGAAALFRAAAKAEDVHAARLAEVIRNMGAQPKADIRKPEVKSTKKNVEAALKGETYERDVMYPGFIKTAKGEENAEAMQVFIYAVNAETEHARLYDDALKNLNTYKAKRVFYVCTYCGYTTTNLDFNSCVSCSHPKEAYEKVQ